MCEGQNEEVLLNLLLDAGALNFTRDDLIGRRPYPIRQLSNPIIRTELKHYGCSVVVYRIGDKQKDELVIPKELKNIVSKNQIFKYCTKPELEMLLILNESLEQQYEKVKNEQSPKTFAKRNIVFNSKKYNQSGEFLMQYYGGERITNLIANIKKYSKYKRHEKDELYLSDLLKKKISK